MIALSENPKSRKGGPAVGDNDFMLQIVVFVKKKVDISFQCVEDILSTLMNLWLLLVAFPIEYVRKNFTDRSQIYLRSN